MPIKKSRTVRSGLPRAAWSGSITFGMVTIPIHLHGTSKSHDVGFHRQHVTCKGGVGLKNWCKDCDIEVPADQIERAYEYTKGASVVVTDEDLESLPVPTKQVIDLTTFVDASEVDPMLAEKAYWAEPDDIGFKPYALLVGAMKRKRKVGIAKVTLRNKESLCALRVGPDDRLVLETLSWPDELLGQEAGPLPAVDISPAEGAMADQLVEAFSEPLDLSKYQDDYTVALDAMIQAKVNGAEPPQATPAAPAAQGMDLMAALQATLAARKQVA
jgi:DNA end-binding protein Ku